MNTRQNDFINILNENKYLSFSKLAEKLHYSESTIRRDANYLSKEGFVKVQRGGVLYIEKENIEAPIEYKKNVNQKEKKYIAALASEYIETNQVIFLDGSSTSNALSTYLRNFKSLNIYTTNLDTALYLAHHTQNKVNVIGGQVNDVIVSGTSANWNIAQMYYDIAFISCRGIDLKYGITDRLQSESSIKRLIGSHAKKLILLVDDSKFDQSFTYLDFQLNSIDCLVTNKKPEPRYIDFCKENQIELAY